MIVALGFAIALCVLVSVEVHEYKIDRHIWDIPPSLYSGNRLLVWCGQICYVASAGLVKVSVLLFYRRLSTSFSRGFKIATWIGIAYNVLYVLAFLIALLVECRPLNSYWLAFDEAWLKAGNTYTCPTSEHVQLPASSGLSVLGDAYATLLPLCLVYTLDMPRRQKMALYGLFALGFLVVAAGIARTVILDYLINHTYDNSWWLYETWVWALVELFIAISAASAPALKPFFRKFFLDPMSHFSAGSKSGSSRPIRRNGSTSLPMQYRKGKRENDTRDQHGEVSWSGDASTVRQDAARAHDLDVEKIGVAVTQDRLVPAETVNDMEMRGYRYDRGNQESRNLGIRSAAAVPYTSARGAMSLDIESEDGISRQPSQSHTTSSTEWILPPVKVQPQSSDPLRAYRAEIEALPRIPSETLVPTQSSIRRTASLEHDRPTPKSEQAQRPSTGRSASATKATPTTTSSQHIRNFSQHSTDRSFQGRDSGPLSQHPYDPAERLRRYASLEEAHIRQQSTLQVRDSSRDRRTPGGSVAAARARVRQLQTAQARDMTNAPSSGIHRERSPMTDGSDDGIDYSVLDPPIVAGALVGRGRGENVRASSRLSNEYSDAGQDRAGSRTRSQMLDRTASAERVYQAQRLEDDSRDLEEPTTNTDRASRRTWNTNTFLDQSGPPSPEGSDSDLVPDHNNYHLPQNQYIPPQPPSRPSRPAAPHISSQTRYISRNNSHNNAQNTMMRSSSPTTSSEDEIEYYRPRPTRKRTGSSGNGVGRAL